ncbi:hypothetical protein BKA62DRAFT_512526 [Auriculariales sp. MPI-PUGE-AT-0066]|nr:hypothetical protein BKA62DRAFT_512526 [Auriculariales sp. MPI-PUGE-AT-0066]
MLDPSRLLFLLLLLLFALAGIAPNPLRRSMGVYLYSPRARPPLVVDAAAAHLMNARPVLSVARPNPPRLAPALRLPPPVVQYYSPLPHTRTPPPSALAHPL